MEPITMTLLAVGGISALLAAKKAKAKKKVGVTAVPALPAAGREGTRPVPTGFTPMSQNAPWRAGVVPPPLRLLPPLPSPRVPSTLTFKQPEPMTEGRVVKLLPGFSLPPLAPGLVWERTPSKDWKAVRKKVAFWEGLLAPLTEKEAAARIGISMPGFQVPSARAATVDGF